jgi:hypothetical protein
MDAIMPGIAVEHAQFALFSFLPIFALRFHFLNTSDRSVNLHI